MEQAQTPQNPYRMVLEAGAIHAKAARLETQARYLEDGARIALGHDGPTAQTLIPGTILCMAFGGPADGQVARPPTNAVTPTVAMVPTSGTDLKATPYEPAVIFRVGNINHCMAVVPEGGRREFFYSLRDIEVVDSEKAHAMAKLLIDGIGFHPEMVAGLVQTIFNAAMQDNIEATADSPILMQLGVGQ